LDRFVPGHDESAFAALVERPGRLVVAVCRSVLHDPGDAEDAFQATFLVLVKKAGAVRNRAALSGWLHRVARRVALQANADAQRRHRQEQQAGAWKSVESSRASLPHELVT